MVNRARLITFGVLAGLAAGALAAPMASATSVSLAGPDSRFGSPGQVTVIVGDRKDHAINVRFERDDDEFVITDSRRFDRLASECRRIAKRRVRCHDPAPQGSADVELDGGRGDDRLRVDGTVRGFATIDAAAGADRIRVARRARGGGDLEGGDGRDRIIGGGGDETIGDGAGADLVRGRGGDELVFVDLSSEDRGHNRIFTGAGADDILAKNGHRDELLDCGPGRDEAGLDRIDPKPRSCEHVRRYRRMPGSGRR
jgi:Ca2+-binding RTX toxin-like protein